MLEDRFVRELDGDTDDPLRYLRACLRQLGLQYEIGDSPDDEDEIRSASSQEQVERVIGRLARRLRAEVDERGKERFEAGLREIAAKHGEMPLVTLENDGRMSEEEADLVLRAIDQRMQERRERKV
jgi:hypothetical protein